MTVSLLRMRLIHRIPEYEHAEDFVTNLFYHMFRATAMLHAS